jgi:hypothetical protein
MTTNKSALICDHLSAVPSHIRNKTTFDKNNEIFYPYMVLDRYLTFIKESIYMNNMEDIEIEKFPFVQKFMKIILEHFKDRNDVRQDKLKILYEGKIQMKHFMISICSSLKFRGVHDDFYQSLKDNSEFLLNNFPELLKLHELLFDGDIKLRVFNKDGKSECRSYSLEELPEIGDLVKTCFENFENVYEFQEIQEEESIELYFNYDQTPIEEFTFSSDDESAIIEESIKDEIERKKRIAEKEKEISISKNKEE